PFHHAQHSRSQLPPKREGESRDSRGHCATRSRRVTDLDPWGEDFSAGDSEEHCSDDFEEHHFGVDSHDKAQVGGPLLKRCQSAKQRSIQVKSQKRQSKNSRRKRPQLHPHAMTPPRSSPPSA